MGRFCMLQAYAIFRIRLLWLGISLSDSPSSTMRFLQRCIAVRLHPGYGFGTGAGTYVRWKLRRKRCPIFPNKRMTENRRCLIKQIGINFVEYLRMHLEFFSIIDAEKAVLTGITAYMCMILHYRLTDNDEFHLSAIPRFLRGETLIRIVCEKD